MIEPWEILIKSQPADPQFWKVPNHLGRHRILCVIPDSHSMVAPNRVNADVEFTLEFAEALSVAGIARIYADKLWGRALSTWLPLDNEAAVSKWLQTTVLCVISSNKNPPQEWGVWTRNHDGETLKEILTHSIRGDDVADVLRSPPLGLAKLMSAPGEWENVIKAKGILQHPYHTDPNIPDPEWMPAYPIVSFTADDENYDHLKSLFAGLELPPYAHCAAYTYLLASFHVVSLEAPRPLLVVDSWERGRGKSELSASIKYLIDKKEGVKSIRKGNDVTADESIASLRLARVEVLDNIDKRVDYMHQVATTATTSVLEARAKFDKNSSEFPGKLFIMNGVVGAASFHRDMLVRTLRVEITGKSKQLTIVPIEHAKKYRHEIIKEILMAHHFTKVKVEAPQTRMRAFLEAGLKAYCHVFDVKADVARKLLQEALDSGKLYSKRVLGALMQQHEDLLEDPYFPAGGIADEMVGSNFTITLQEKDLGAKAFGLQVEKDGDKYVWK